MTRVHPQNFFSIKAKKGVDKKTAQLAEAVFNYACRKAYADPAEMFRDIILYGDLVKFKKTWLLGKPVGGA